MIGRIIKYFAIGAAFFFLTAWWASYHQPIGYSTGVFPGFG